MAEHRFFERYLDVTQDELEDFYNFCIVVEQKMLNGELPGISKDYAQSLKAENHGCLTTRLLSHYNIFQMQHKVIRKLYAAVRDMAKEACEHYGKDFDNMQYYVQGWINVEDADDCTLEEYEEHHIEPNLHEHSGGLGMPDIHGYYCVNAEPSTTHYRINGTIPFRNENKNNRAILSETGHKHARGHWGDSNKKRITLAYDTRVVESIQDGGGTSQHWVPLI